MFERYTEKARRTIFFGRFEASQLGSPYIETEHLLLGLLREDKGLTHRFLKNADVVKLIREQIEDSATAAGKNPPISTSVDLPLSNECKRVLAYAAEEAERLTHRHIGCEHILLGLMREEKSFAAEILRQQGVGIPAVREELEGAGASAGSASGQPVESKPPLKMGVDLVARASRDEQPPLVGREKELEQVIRILGRLKRNNPVLLGEPGVGRKTIAYGLAHRIANGDLPAGMSYQAMDALDLAMFIVNVGDRAFYDEFLRELLNGASQRLYFIEGMERLAGSGSVGQSLEIVHLLRPALMRGTIQCIGIATPSRYRQLLETESWVERCFEPVMIRELNEAETLKVLLGSRERYEAFHRVSYTEEALRYAVFLSNSYVVNRFLPDKALDLIDEAGAWLKLNQPQAPQEVKDCQKRLKSVANRMENAVSNHEFEKAQRYSQEVRKEQEELNLLREKYKIDHAIVVTGEIIEDVVSRWTGIPVSAIRKSRLPEPEAG